MPSFYSKNLPLIPSQVHEYELSILIGLSQYRKYRACWLSKVMEKRSILFLH